MSHRYFNFHENSNGNQTPTSSSSDHPQSSIPAKSLWIDGRTEDDRMMIVWFMTTPKFLFYRMANDRLLNIQRGKQWWARKHNVLWINHFAGVGTWKGGLNFGLYNSIPSPSLTSYVAVIIRWIWWILGNKQRQSASHCGFSCETTTTVHIT